MRDINQDKYCFSNVYGTVHLMLLSSKVNSDDISTYYQAMNGPDHDCHSDAIDVKIKIN